ncbi:hypothetical protein [Kiloniella sp.]|uniref:hypothetical protein n=1 Tax=Kiloniella sp. TaxID=1938587 RepID=UPI003B014936
MKTPFYPHELDLHPDKERILATVEHFNQPTSQEVQDLENKLSEAADELSSLKASIEENLIPVVKFVEDLLNKHREEGDLFEDDWGMLFFATAMLSREDLNQGKEQHERVEKIYNSIPKKSPTA